MLVSLLMPLAMSSMACQYDEATAACYTLAEGIGNRLYTCGYVASPAAGEQAVHDGWATAGLNCETSPISIADERMFYDVCPGELEVFDCALLLEEQIPASCMQILYRSR